MTVLVLGAGPAGLAAAHALVEQDREVTVLEHRLAALAREKAAWRRRVRRREAPRGAYDEWRRGMESDVRACVERIEEIGCSSIEEEVW